MIKNAKFIITDTFHATVFSTLFHKNFVFYIVLRIRNQKNLDNRIDGQVDRLGIEKDYIIEDLTDIDGAAKMYNGIVDYSIIDSRLMEWRNSSLDFLKSVLNK